MKYSKPSNKSFTATIKHLLLMAFAILTIGCGEKKSEDVNLDELEVREGVFYLKSSNSPYTGKFFDFRDNGQKKGEANLKDGKPDGLTVSWHENGQKQAEINYKDDKFDGLFVAWYENGQKKTEGNFKDGKQHGLSVLWHKNGQKQAEGNYKDNEPISEKFWNSKGEEVDSLEEADQ
jgi:antitoxin component YwqK of YwqJK toxin-antitoxin module